MDKKHLENKILAELRFLSKKGSTKSSQLHAMKLLKEALVEYGFQLEERKIDKHYRLWVLVNEEYAIRLNTKTLEYKITKL